MRKCKVSLILILAVLITYAEACSNNSNGTPIDSKTKESVLSPEDTAVTYRLFPTQNMWTFIKLNTRNGQMWQVQFDVQGNNRFVTNLNEVSLVMKGKEADDRFTLYHTQNMWTFVLLDQLDGRVWQVQWSTKAKERLIVPIE
jgi:hypothetical protein